jgi:catalase
MRVKQTEYDQARELWTNVMSAKQRNNTCSNTVEMIRHVSHPVSHPVIVVSAISFNSRLIFAATSNKISSLSERTLSADIQYRPRICTRCARRLAKKDFAFSEVEELSKTAQEWYKEKKFRPSPGNRLIGYAP